MDDLETTALAEHEAVIERGLNTFVDVGTALLAIRDDRLYKADYSTFEEYCRDRWGMTKDSANRTIRSAEVARSMSPIGLTPATESQARELARVPEPHRDQVWRETVERTNGKPTAAAIRETYQPPEPEPEPVRLPERQEVADTILGVIDEQVAKPKAEPVMLTLHTNTGKEVQYPKPQAKATFNETTGEGISWAAWSWNPVTGCLHGCKYCYARAIANRFTEAYPAGFTPLFHEERLDAPTNTILPARYRDDHHPWSCGRGDCEICAYRRVFVCSMADLYGRWVPDEWIEQVHASMLASPQWQYILLTKFPARYVGLKLPPQSWVGTSVDEQKRVRIAEDAFRKIDGAVKWLSLEPLREPLEFSDLSMFDWVVIGAQTGTRQPDGWEPDFMPPWEWICRITAQAKEAGCKVHWKPNLLNGKPGLPPNEYPEF